MSAAFPAVKRFEASGASLAYAEGPACGEPLLLVHGITGCWQSFLPVMAGLARRHHVVALDLRGHGGSGRAARYRVSDYADDLVDFISAKMPKGAVLIGHSMGGHAALMAAGQLDLKALVLEDIPLKREAGRLAPQGAQPVFAIWRSMLERTREAGEIEALLAREAPEPDAARLRLKAEMLALTDPDALDAYMADAFTGYDPETCLATLACPVLALQADPKIFARLDDEALSALSARPGVTGLTIAGAGHNVHGEAPDRWLGAVEGFLAGL